MKLKMLVSMAGIGFALSPGDETERFSDGEAARLIEAGYAVPVREGQVERAVKVAPEKAARSTPKISEKPPRDTGWTKG